MTDIVEFAMKTVPSLIGLALIVYAALRVRRSGSEFFAAARSWVFSFFMLSLAILWFVELIEDTTHGWWAESNIYVELTFVVVSMWLSTCMVALSTMYRRRNALEQFATFLREQPVNVITVLGALALGILAPMWFTDLSDPDRLRDNSWVLVLVLSYIVLCALVDAGLALRAKRFLIRLSGTAGFEIQLLVLAWLGIPVTEFALDIVGDSVFSIGDYNPYAWIIVFLFAAITESATGRGFSGLIVDPEVEDVKRSGFRVYDIPRGVYLIEEERPGPAFNLFSELVTLPLHPDVEIPGRAESASETLEYLIPRGLVVTREYPDLIRKNYNLQVTPIVWLTETPGEMRIAPTSLAVLTDTVARFMESNPNSIVLVEGIEYVITFNDFKKVMRSLDTLNETAWVTRSRLILTIDPRAFDERELALLERDRRVVKGAQGIEELKRGSRLETPHTA